FVGAVVVLVHSDRAPLSRMGALLALTIITCVVNELILLRRWSAEPDLVSQAKKQALTVTIATWILMTAWGWFCLGLWIPPSSDTFGLLILSCSLAAVTTMFSAHAAAATGAFSIIAFFITVLELMNSFTTRSPLITLAIVYMILMAVQSYAIHV